MKKREGTKISNNIKNKFVIALGAVVIASSITLGANALAKKISSSNDLANGFFNKYFEQEATSSEAQNFYEKDAIVPAGYFNSCPITIGVSNTFSDVEFEKIENAIKKLDSIADGIKFEIVRTKWESRRDHDQIIILKDNKNYTAAERGVIGSSSIQKSDKTKPEDYCGTIWISPDADIECFESITIHRILKLLGFKSENNKDSIMYDYAEINKNDLTNQDIININTKFPAQEEGKEVYTFTLSTNVYEKDNFVPAGYFNEHPIKIAISESFSNEKIEQIEKALRTLDNYAEGIKFEIVRTPYNYKRTNEQIAILRDAEGKYTDSKGHVGVARSSSKEKTKPEDYCGIIYLSDNIEAESVESVSMHETLHILGFKHEENDRYSVMYPKTWYYTEPSENDIIQINKKFPAAEQEQ